jgi:hypothetical protein
MPHAPSWLAATCLTIADFVIMAVVAGFISSTQKQKMTSPASGELTREGLDGFLREYRLYGRLWIVWLVGAFSLPFAIWLLLRSFYGLAALAGYVLLFYMASLRPSLGDYRTYASKLVTGKRDDSACLTLLNKLDWEMRRGAMIAHSLIMYYLFPSALIADNSLFASRPRITPTDDIVSMSMSRSLSRNTTHQYRMYLYGKDGDYLTSLTFDIEEEARNLMEVLKLHFNVEEKPVK